MKIRIERDERQPQMQHAVGQLKIQLYGAAELLRGRARGMFAELIEEMHEMLANEAIDEAASSAPVPNVELDV